MSNRINARNIELYIGKITDLSEFTPASKGTITLAKYVDNKINEGTIVDFMRFSKLGSEISIDPAEDDTDTALRFGIDASGSQNAIQTTTTNVDVDITLTVDETINAEMKEYVLEKLDSTVTDFADYQAFNYGAMSKDNLVLLVRKKLTIGELETYNTILITNPLPVKPIATDISSDDSEVTQEVELRALKGNVYEDIYTEDETKEVLDFESES